MARLYTFPLQMLQFLMRFSMFWVFWRWGLLKVANMERALGPFRDVDQLPFFRPSSQPIS